jgi:hypothetical protein
VTVTSTLFGSIGFVVEADCETDDEQAEARTANAVSMRILFICL